MLKINRIKCIIITADDGNFGYDYKFETGLNLISSTENTKGKSSILEAIYYCLGVEELLGAVDEKALTPVYKTAIDYKEKKNIIPLKTMFYLEITNERGDIVTINRNIERLVSNKLINVYSCNLDNATNGERDFQEMFVNTAGGATSDKGFHKFLEKFIGWRLPVVPSFEEKDRKLYLQTLFSAMFIEQKRGWSNLLATIPNYGIKDSKTKVIEYILNLDTIENERLKIECKIEESIIKQKWKKVIENITDLLSSENCVIRNLFENPRIIDENNLKQMTLFKRYNEEEKELKKYIEERNKKAKSLSQQSLKVGKNIEELEENLKKLQNELQEKFERRQQKKRESILEEKAIDKLIESLEIINKDLNSNKDINKLKGLGALKTSCLSKDICPTCKQNIKDYLLEQNLINRIMNVDEQIQHLSDQKKMVEFSLRSHKSNLLNIQEDLKILETEITKKTKDIRRIVNDIYSTDECLSTSIVYEKLNIENEVERLLEMEKKIEYYKKELLTVSNDWASYLEKKSKLPKGIFSEDDLKKINELKNEFIKKIENYNYSSNQNIYDIEISKDKLMPTLNGFDLIKDGSGSDLIRIIWGFTLSLLAVSNKNDGNHSKLVIIDEPAQQSIENKDLYSFIDDLINNFDNSQIIMAITLNNLELQNYVRNKDNLNIVLIEDKAVKPLDKLEQE